MLEIRERVGKGSADLKLTLPFEARQRTRRRVVLGSGEDALLLTPRGIVLRGGDLLELSDGRRVEVVAAEEQVSSVHSTDARTLARAAYHLGNRHVALEVGEGFVRYQSDHVLDDMVRELGLEPRHESAPFEPEGGAYSGAHSHGHAHGHGLTDRVRLEHGAASESSPIDGRGAKP
jgi:urease accessory protein